MSILSKISMITSVSSSFTTSGSPSWGTTHSPEVAHLTCPWSCSSTSQLNSVTSLRFSLPTDLRPTSCRLLSCGQLRCWPVSTLCSTGVLSQVCAGVFSSLLHSSPSSVHLSVRLNTFSRFSLMLASSSPNNSHDFVCTFLSFNFLSDEREVIVVYDHSNVCHWVVEHRLCDSQSHEHVRNKLSRNRSSHPMSCSSCRIVIPSVWHTFRISPNSFCNPRMLCVCHFTCTISSASSKPCWTRRRKRTKLSLSQEGSIVVYKSSWVCSCRGLKRRATCRHLTNSGLSLPFSLPLTSSGPTSSFADRSQCSLYRDPPDARILRISRIELLDTRVHLSQGSLVSYDRCERWSPINNLWTAIPFPASCICPSKLSRTIFVTNFMIVSDSQTYTIIECWLKLFPSENMMKRLKIRHISSILRSLLTVDWPSRSDSTVSNSTVIFSSTKLCPTLDMFYNLTS